MSSAPCQAYPSRSDSVQTMSGIHKSFSTYPFLPSPPKVLSPILIPESHSTNTPLTLSLLCSHNSRSIPIPNSDNAAISSFRPSNVFRRSSLSPSTFLLRFPVFPQRSARYCRSPEILRHGKHAQQASPSPQPDTKSGRSKTTQAQQQQAQPQQPPQPQQQHRRNDEYSSRLTTSTGKQLLRSIVTQGGS